MWGTGSATREFLYAEAIVLAAERYHGSKPVNLSTGAEISIKDLVGLIAQHTGVTGRVVWDVSKPDGQPRRMLNTARAAKYFGFVAKASFEEGLRKAIDWSRRSRDLRPSSS